MIGRRRFEVGAVAADLARALDAERALGVIAPATGVRRAVEREAERIEAEPVAEEVIGGDHAAIFEVPGEEAAVGEERAGEPGDERGRERVGATGELDGGEPVHGAQGDLERGGVVDATADGVVVEEAVDLVGDFVARALGELGMHARGGGELDEVTGARQLPAALGIDAFGEQAVAGTATAQERIAAPVDARAEVARGTEDVDLVTQDRLGAGAQAHDGVGEERAIVLRDRLDAEDARRACQRSSRAATASSSIGGGDGAPTSRSPTRRATTRKRSAGAATRNKLRAYARSTRAI